MTAAAKAEWVLEGNLRLIGADRLCAGACGHPTPEHNWLAHFLCMQSGLVIGAGQHVMLERLLKPLMRESALPDLPALVDRLRAQPADELARQVIEAMSTNETLFFRDNKPFAHLITHSLPTVATMGPPERPIRVWSAGTSSGQEAYSIAMIAAENAALLEGRAVHILGTDIAGAQLVRAKTGVYTQFEVQRGLPSRRLLRHFNQIEGGWQIDPALRAMCQFGLGNLLHDPAPLGAFDIVFCRNVLLYFDEQTRRMVLAALSRQLAPGGWLYLGRAESAADLCLPLEPCASGEPFYRATGNAD